MADSRISSSRKVSARAGDSTRVSLTKKKKKRKAKAKTAQAAQASSPQPAAAAAPTAAPNAASSDGTKTP